MLFLWPLVLLAIFMILTYKTLILIGEMFIDVGEWVRDFDHPVLRVLIARLRNWVFKD